MGLVALWHVECSGPGIKSLSPEWAGRFLSTASLGKSQTLVTPLCMALTKLAAFKAQAWGGPGGGRSWILPLSTDLDLVVCLHLFSQKAGERGFPSRLPGAAKIRHSGRRTDFEDSQQSLPHIHSSCRRTWHWGCLGCLLNFSIIVS